MINAEKVKPFHYGKVEIFVRTIKVVFLQRFLSDSALRFSGTVVNENLTCLRAYHVETTVLARPPELRNVEPCQ